MTAKNAKNKGKDSNTKTATLSTEDKAMLQLHPLERAVLTHISKDMQSIQNIAAAAKISEGEALVGLQFLEQKNYATISSKETHTIQLTKKGKEYVDKPLPEQALIEFLEQNNLKANLQDIPLDNKEKSAAMGELKKKQLITLDKTDKGLALQTTKENIAAAKEIYNNKKLKAFTAAKETLTKEEQDDPIIKAYTESTISKTQSAAITKAGEKLQTLFNDKYKNIELAEAVTTDDIKTKAYDKKTYRHYDINTNTSIPSMGRAHPTIEANNILRDIFLEMGFTEMKGPMVEAAFWNMDTMWIPQDHPARDEQDTFYLKGTATLPKELVKHVKEMHEKGLKRTHTNQGEWSEDIAAQLLLRTHSTATSFRTLYKLGQELKEGKDIDGKYFYIANNFRNEAIDATHLADFYQGEGFIVGDNLSLADLMGFIKAYYQKLGITQIKFKPTYNPYTEPSMEAHYYDPQLKKWYSLINSGIFRPETLAPLGLENKRIIAWGLGASRVATLLSGKSSMRDITGTTCDFEWLKTRPVMTRHIVRDEK